MDAQSNNKAIIQGVYALLANWVTSVGAVTLVLIMGIVMSKQWLPAMVLACFLLLKRRSRSNASAEMPVCNLLPHLIARVLLLTAFIMVGINIYYMRIMDPVHLSDGTVNPEIPYISILIIAPLSTVILGWALIRRSHLSFCYDCQARYGHAAERGFIGHTFDRESQYQLRLLTVTSAVTCLYAWTYYFVHYSNASYSSSDKFYYIWIPVILYLMSLFGMLLRYWSIYAFYTKNIVGEGNVRTASTNLRYIIVCGDHVLLAPGPDGRLDTPASLYIPFRERISDHDARQTLDGIIGHESTGKLRLLYINSNYNAHCNIFHYLCSVKSRSAMDSSRWENATWVSQQQLARLVNERSLALLLTSEIRRIYTVSMAYKAYRPDGRRLYGIKHYKPCFNIHEVLGLDVDFNNPQWLYVARFNEDKPFFRLRRLIHRCFN